jgi:hypothetical protein
MAVAINRDTSLIYLEEAEVSQWGGSEMGGVSLFILIIPGFGRSGFCAIQDVCG